MNGGRSPIPAPQSPTPTTRRITLGLFLLSVLIINYLPLVETSTPKFTIQTRVFVDLSGLKVWAKQTRNDYTRTDILKSELTATMVDVSKLFSLGINEGNEVSINFDFRGVDVEQKDIVTASSWKIEADKASLEFKSWLGGQTEQFDVEILFTGYDISDAAGSAIQSHSRHKSICTGAVTIVKLNTTYTDVLNVAKEIAHILGATGKVDSALVQCQEKYVNGYLMNPDPLTPKIYRLSKCSYNEIVERLKSIPVDRNCLNDGNRDAVLDGDPLFKYLETADEICKRYFGPLSSVPRKRFFTYGQDICSRLACQKGWDDVVSVPTPNTMMCGENKECNFGQCIDKTASGTATSPDWCPFGDQPDLQDHPEGLQCKDLPSTECQEWGMECCNRCDLAADLHSADEFCRERVGPNSALMRQAYFKSGRTHEYGDKLCGAMVCLIDVEDNMESSEIVVAPDHLVCGQNKRCYGGKCLEVTGADANHMISDSCPFGDQPMLTGGATCTTLVPRRLLCDTWERHCCGTCDRLYYDYYNFNGSK